MNTKVILGMMVAISFQMAFAATARNVEGIRKVVREEIGRSKNGSTGNTVDAVESGKTAEYLARMSGASEVELRPALQRTITVKEVDGNKTISLNEVGTMLKVADEGFRKIDRTSLDASGKAHLEILEEGLKVIPMFLSLANRTSEMGAKLSTQQQTEVDAFFKQISLTEDMLTKMDTADAKAHIEVMKKAIAKRTSPKVAGDQAFAAALKEGKSQEDYIAKLQELLNCVR